MERILKLFLELLKEYRTVRVGHVRSNRVLFESEEKKLAEIDRECDILEEDFRKEFNQLTQEKHHEKDSCRKD